MIDVSPPRSGRFASDARQRLAALLRHADAPALHPLAFAQQRMWFLEALEDRSIAYNEWRAVRLDGHVDEQEMAAAVRDLVATHAALRTTFVAHAGEALQVVAAAREVPLEILDLTDASDADVRARLTSEAWRPFDLTRGPLFRACLARRGHDASILLLTWHHIIADGWSTRVMFEEISRSYAAVAAGTPTGARPPGWQFADYVSAQRERLSGTARETQLDYWRQRFSMLPPALRLPSDRPRPVARSSRGGSRRFCVSVETAAQARALARTHGTTLFTVLLTAWMTVLSRYSRETDIVVGAPVAGRTRPETEPLVGFFANTLAIRADIDGELPFAGALDRVRAATLGALAHQELPFDLIVDAVRPPRDLSQAPLFQTMLALQDDPVRALHLPGVAVSTFDIPASTAKFDLHWLFEEQAGGGVAGWLQYSADLFDEATADRIVSHLLRLLDAAVRTPDVTVHALDLLPDDERQRVARTWNDTATQYPSETLVDLLEAQSARTPEAIAVEFEGDAVTYAAFTAQVRQVAARLRTLGAGPGDRIGVCLERSIDLVIALHAAVRSGAAFVPLDPSYPNERLQWLANDARVAVLVTDANGLSRLGRPADTQLLLLGGNDDPRSAECETSGHAAAIGPDDLAYLLYTSGSTGQPKGALNTHRGICNRLRWMQEYYPLSSHDAVLQKTPIGFDVSVWEFFWPLATGARLVVARPDGHRDPAYLTDVIASRSITTLHFVPSMLQMFLEAPDVERCTSLRHVICSGEALPADLVRRFMARTRAAIHNLYGPTEAAIDVTAWTCGADSAMRSTIPLGRPVPNTSIYIVDSRLALAPIGVPGELCIGGVQVARGYWNRPELTAERFVADPFSTAPGASMYRTGDLACWRPDGTLEFLGRLDDQIKIRGCRVEPGEIEGALAAHADVQDAIVVARRDEGDTRLVAYVIPRPVAGDAEVSGALEDWSGVFDEVYEGGDGLDDDFSGWTSSYTGEPIPPAEMRQWADAAASIVLAQRPERVLEIGVGTGLLLSRIAPSCREYVGIDASRRGIERLRRALAGRPDLAHVRVEHALAHDTAGLPAARFDTVVINSVAQYFPGFEYFVRVIGAAVRATRPGGAIVLGDLRLLPLLEAFHAAVQITRTEPDTTVKVVREAVARQIAQEKELVFDPGMFAELRRRVPAIGAVRATLKSGRVQNELTQFRFDAVLFIGAAPAPGATLVLDWSAEALTIDTLRSRLAATREPHVLVRGIRNPRLVFGTAVARMLERAPDDSLIAAVRDAAADEARRAAELPDADDLRAAAAAAGWQVDVGFDPASATSMSALFARHGAPAWEGDAGWPIDAAPTRADDCASDPLFEARRCALVPALRRHCEQVLTSFMVPSSFVVLRRWPIGSTGKLDRRALPAPERQAMAAVTELPGSDTEARLAALWRELLRVDGVGATDHFFELGGHSLLAMQLVGRVRRTFGIGLPLRVVFESPTLSALAERVDAAMAEASDEGSVPVAARLPRAARGGDLPHASGERRLWFLDAFQPGSFAYNVPARLRIAGPVDIPGLQAALDAVVARHAALRTTYPSVEGRPVRRVDAGRRIALRVMDLSSMPAGARAAEADRVYREEALAPIALDGVALVRVALVRHEATRHDLIIVAHHIVCDGWSFGLLMHDLEAAYRGAGVAASADDPDYADYAAWEAGWLTSPEAMRQLAYWRERLAGPLPVLQLPSDRPRPALQTFAGANESQPLPASLVGAIDAACRDRGVTPFMVTLAGFVALLHRYTGAEDVIVGTPVANRRHPETASMVGFFVNTLPIRVAVTGDVTFEALLTRVRDAALAAFDHQELPFERLVEEVQPDRQLAYPPICQVMFAYQNARVPDLCLPGAAPARLEFPGGTAKFDLTVFAEPTEGGLTFTAEYNVDLFRPSAMQRLLGHLATVIGAGLAAPESRVAHLPILTPEERARQLATWNDTARPEHEPARIEALVARQAAQTPHRMAVVHGSRQLTYAELSSRAARMARAIAHAGVARGDRVGIALPPSAEWLVAVLGTLEGGATYVPLDPGYPAARLETMARSAGLAAIISVRGVAAPDGPWARIDVDPTIHEVGSESAGRPAASEWDDHLYVIFTSGSTGGPKGAAVTHRGFANLLRWYVGAFSFSEHDRVLLASSTSFDLTQKNLFAPLLAGGSLHVPQSGFYDPDALVAQIRDEAITVINTTPSAFYPLVERAEATGYRSLASLRLVVLGGEPIATSRLDRWRRSPAFGARIVNTYGPTECTDICASHQLTDDDFAGTAPVPIGRPIWNVAIAVLDARSEPCPAGVPGELVIGGAGVGPGYVNDDALTAARFAPNHLAEWPGTRLYRTGDCVRQRDDGAIEFLGRFDHQVKVRGFRVEIGEIESAIAAHGGVSDCAVVTDRVSGNGAAATRLVAFAVLRPGASVNAAELRGFVAPTLPDYMVPSRIHVLEALPTTPNGKVDRLALAVLAARPVDAATEAPAPAAGLEESVAAIWRRVLGLAHVGRHDNFFDLGGQSLLVVAVQLELRRAMGREVAVVDLFRYPTVSSLAAHLAASESAAPSDAARASAHERGRRQREAFARAGRPRGRA